MVRSEKEGEKEVMVVVGLPCIKTNRNSATLKDKLVEEMDLPGVGGRTAASISNMSSSSAVSSVSM